MLRTIRMSIICSQHYLAAASHHSYVCPGRALEIRHCWMRCRLRVVELKSVYVQRHRADYTHGEERHRGDRLRVGATAQGRSTPRRVVNRHRADSPYSKNCFGWNRKVSLVAKPTGAGMRCVQDPSYFKLVSISASVKLSFDPTTGIRQAKVARVLDDDRIHLSSRNTAGLEHDHRQIHSEHSNIVYDGDTCCS